MREYINNILLIIYLIALIIFSIIDIFTNNIYVSICLNTLLVISTILLLFVRKNQKNIVYRLFWISAFIWFLIKLLRNLYIIFIFQ